MMGMRYGRWERGKRVISRTALTQVFHPAFNLSSTTVFFLIAAPRCMESIAMYTSTLTSICHKKLTYLFDYEADCFSRQGLISDADKHKSLYSLYTLRKPRPPLRLNGE